jgi:hypothetical protein
MSLKGIEDADGDQIISEFEEAAGRIENQRATLTSVPAKEKAAVTNTLQRPLNPELKAPEVMLPGGCPSCVYPA